MSFVNILLMLLNNKGITKAKLLSDLKLGKNQFKYWEDNGNIPNGETLSKIAEYFNVTIDYLLGKEEQKEKPADNGELSDMDIKFINDLNSLNPDQQEMVRKFVRSLKP